MAEYDEANFISTQYLTSMEHYFIANDRNPLTYAYQYRENQLPFIVAVDKNNIISYLGTY